MENANQIAAELLASCRNDPLKFVEVMYPWGEEGTALEHHKGPRKWQRDVLIQIRDHLNGPHWDTPLRLSVASGHGIGKSALISWITHWGMMTMVDAKGVLTANTESQLRSKTWPEGRKWFELCAVKDFFEMEGTTFRAKDPSLRMTWRLDAIPWSATNPESFAGLHNEGKRILVMFDEASAIDDKIWEVVEGAMTDAETQILWIVFGNPTRANGRFYMTHHQHRKLWKTWSIDSRDVEGTNKRQLEEWVTTYGLDSDFVRVRVRGLFARTGSNQLISTGHILSAQQRDGELAPQLTDPLIFGVDVARFGGDESVLVTRKGAVAGIHGIYAWRGLDTIGLADKIGSLIKLHRPHYVFIDGGGVGGGVIDVLRHRGFDVDEIMFGGKSPDLDYANRRAYMWVKMKQWLEGEVSIPWNDTGLFEELSQQTYLIRETKNNDLILTSKDAMRREGLPSPDRADALALTFAHEVAPVVRFGDDHLRDTSEAETDYRGGWE